MIKKIDIKKFGLFSNYVLDTSIGKNEIIQKLNIIYGRNYSGKTTLARIFKCIEDCCIHSDYSDGNFSITLNDGKIITQNNLGDFGNEKKMRVYNTDFINENLSWLHNNDGTIKPFTVLGAKNVELDKKIKEIEDKLGKEDDKKNLLFVLLEKNNAFLKAQKDFETLTGDLNGKLTQKAKSIKTNTATFNSPVYTFTHISADIPKATDKAILSDDQIEEKKKLLKEESKSNIPRLPETKPKFSVYYSQVDELLKRQIKPSQPIADLIHDSLLQEWVRQGIDKHKGKRETCGFCGNTLPADLWGKLDAHFSKESEELRKELKALIEILETAKNGLDNFLTIEKDSFYKTINSKYDIIAKKWAESSKEYSKNIDKLIAQLKQREKDIFKERKLGYITDESENIVNILKEFNLLIDENNLKTQTLSADQQKARTDLKLSEIAKFLKDIDYKKFIGDIEKLRLISVGAENDRKNKQIEIDALLEEKRTLEAQAKDESKGAELVNQHLNHFFGNSELKLVAETNAGIMRFKISRDGSDAKNLSEGECSLISFCYFIAKMEDEMKEAANSDNLVIYIDDPISSLDSNHIFFMFSLIESIIAKPKKYGQLFISTHNLDFLKYLKKLTVPKYKPEPNSKGKPSINHFMIERKNKNKAQIVLSPDYLKNYITEFNYLFNEIYLCSTADDVTIGHSYQYNFGNNMRKFLEAYLFYKYPSHNFSLDQRLEKFFDNDQVTINLINRVVNEYSHLGEHVDRGLEPIDVDAMSKVAKAVVKKIQDNDPHQYAALLESIGVN